MKGKDRGTRNRLHRINKLFPKVQYVVDALAPIMVEVKPRDNRKGGIKDPGDCAMARACKREFNLDGVIISLSKAYLVKGEVATRYSVPTSLSKEVVSFDRNMDFQPGVYHLSAIPPCDRLGAQKRAPHTGVGKKTRPTKAYHRTANVRSFPDRVVVG
jgi:hypothetical protein